MKAERALLGFILFLALGACALYALGEARDGPRERLRQCQENLRAMDTAVHFWMADHRPKPFGDWGHSRSLPRHLTPYYLRTLPTCPTTGRADYAMWSSDYDYAIRCLGDHSEAGLGPGFPAMTPGGIVHETGLYGFLLDAHPLAEWSEAAGPCEPRRSMLEDGLGLPSPCQVPAPAFDDEEAVELIQAITHGQNADVALLKLVHHWHRRFGAQRFVLETWSRLADKPTPTGNEALRDLELALARPGMQSALSALLGLRRIEAPDGSKLADAFTGSPRLKALSAHLEPVRLVSLRFAEFGREAEPTPDEFHLFELERPDLQLLLLGTFSDGTMQDLAPQAKWSLSPPGFGKVDRGLVQADTQRALRAPGRVRAEVGGLSVEARVGFDEYERARARPVREDR